MYFKDYRQIPQTIWRWYSFSPLDIASHGDGSIIIISHALDKLQNLYNMMDYKLSIHSAYRDPLYNAKIGGAPLSRHKYGDAFDIGLGKFDKHKLYQICQQLGFTGFGFYNNFLHIDCGKARHWGSW